MQSMSDVEDRESRPRGVYWLPNLLTTGALFAGFYAIVAAIDWRFDHAGVAVFIAMLFDGLDGRVARWTHTESAFGKEYDSLSDMVSFGLAPAIVTYQWGVARIDRSGGGSAGWCAFSTQRPPGFGWHGSIPARRVRTSIISRDFRARPRRPSSPP